MIVVDTSALMTIVLAEPQAAACMDALEAEDQILISAGTVAERTPALAAFSFGKPNPGYSTHTGFTDFGRGSGRSGSGEISPRHSASRRLATTGAANR